MTTELVPAKVRLSDQFGLADDAQPMMERAAFEAWFLARYSYTRAVLTNPIWAREVSDAEEAFAAGIAAERERWAQYLRDAADRLAPEGKRTAQVDLHVARVLATMGDEIAAGCTRPN